MNKKVIITKENAKELIAKAKVLAEKESRLYVVIGLRQTEEEVGILITHIALPNQHEFAALAKKPSDYTDGEVYMQFGCDASKLILILETLLIFEADITLLQKDGHFYVAGGNKSVTPLDTFAYTDDTKKMFVQANEKEQCTIKSVNAAAFLTAIEKGSTSATSTGDCANVEITFSQKRITVASTDGNRGSSAFTEKLAESSISDDKTILIGVASKQLSCLKSFISESEEFALAVGDKHLFFFSKKGKLYIAMQTQVKNADEIIKSFSTTERLIGTVVIDAAEAQKAIKALGALIAKDTVIAIQVKDKLLQLGSDEEETDLCLPISASEGDVEKMPELMKLEYLSGAIAALEKGNILVSLFAHQQNAEIVIPVFSNEKVGEEYNGMVMVMPINPKAYRQKKDEVKESKAKAEKEVKEAKAKTKK